MKSAQDVLFEYASAFEETYKDDDWSRLQAYFAADAVYEVIGGPLACRIAGAEAIFAGMKKSLDGLDRRCDKRVIEVTDGPHIESGDAGDSVRIDWRVGYEIGGSPRGSFAGASEVLVRDGQIVHLKDLYEDAEMDRFGEWAQQYAPQLDGSYV